MFRGGWLILAATFLLFAHGCHSDDIDHEPGINVQHNDDETRP